MTINNSLLTIVIPTFNRSKLLDELLSRLTSEFDASDSCFNVIALNNASTDNTYSIIEKYKKICPFWDLINRPENIGSEPNIVDGLSRVRTKYCWIIGDDDLPMVGLIKNVIEILKNEKTTLIYIKPYWTPDVTSYKNVVYKPSFREQTEHEIASEANVMTTFISSWIFDVTSSVKSNIQQYKKTFRRGSLFPQLSWILLLIDSKGKYFISKTPGILATAGNTSTDSDWSYGILDTFMYLFPESVNKYINDKTIQDSLLRPYCITFLPRLILSVNGNLFPMSNDKSNTKDRISQHISRYLEFKLFCRSTLIIASLLPKVFLRYLAKIFRYFKRIVFLIVKLLP